MVVMFPRLVYPRRQQLLSDAQLVQATIDDEFRDAAFGQLLECEAHDEAVQPSAAEIRVREAVRHIGNVRWKRQRSAAHCSGATYPSV